MSARLRVTAVVLSLLGLLALAVAPAGAQDSSSYRLDAGAAAGSLTVLGTDLGTFAATSAVARSLPEVVAESAAFVGPDAAAVGASRAVADAAGQAVRDPEGDALACGVPDIPADTPVTGLVQLLEVCSVSAAALDADALPRGGGEADAGVLAVNGQLLADVVFGLLLDPILAQLDGLQTPLRDTVVGPVDEALAAVCEEIPEELDPTAVVAEAEASGLPVRDVIAALPGGQDIVAALGDDCLLSLATIVDLSGVIVDVLEDELRAALLAALDRDLLQVVLGTSASSVSGAGGASTARAELEALAVSSPSLAFLLDAVEGLVADTLQGAIDDVTAVVPAELDGVVAAIPAIDDVLGPVLAALPLDDLVDDEPLLSVQVASSVADARRTAGADAVDTSGSSAGAVIVSLSPAIAGLLGVPATTTVAPGADEVIAEGTPLESRISVGAVETTSDTVDGVAVAGARVTATEVALLTGLEGGIVATVGEATASVGGVAAPPLTSLPQTGGSTSPVPFVLAGLGLAVLVLRRIVRG